MAATRLLGLPAALLAGRNDTYAVQSQTDVGGHLALSQSASF